MQDLYSPIVILHMKVPWFQPSEALWTTSFLGEHMQQKNNATPCARLTNNSSIRSRESLASIHLISFSNRVATFPKGAIAAKLAAAVAELGYRLAILLVNKRPSRTEKLKVCQGQVQEELIIRVLG